MKAAFLAAAVVATAGAVFYFGTGLHAAKAGAPESAGRRSAGHRYAEQVSAAKEAVTSMSLPLVFEPNHGQTAAPVKFLAHGAGYGLFLTANEAVLELHQHAALSAQHAAPGNEHTALRAQAASSSVIRMRLEGASALARVSGGSPLPGKTSYFIGNDPAKWHRDIPQFGRVEYESVYRGVDLVYYGNQGQLEYDFRVAPGADPSQIALSFEGASAHVVAGDSSDSGDLVLSTPNGDVHFHAPRVYQPGKFQPGTPRSGKSSGNESSGNDEKVVAGSFRQLADNKIGFIIGDYDHSRELVIDPVLTYSSYFGGNGIEGPNPTAFPPGMPANLVQVAVDGALNIYLAGSTNSTVFPVTTGPSSVTGTQNIFISKLDPLNYGTGNSQLLYSIILGGTDATEVDSLAGLAVDQNDNIYVAGSTNSATFPTNGTNAPFQATPLAAGTHGFLSKFTVGLNLNTYNLAYSTYLSGTNAAGNAVDYVTGLAVDDSENAYVTGDTTSSNPASDGFPANPNGYQTASNSPGNPQFFASEINTNGSGSLSMVYSTYFGGAYPAVATANGGGIAVSTSGTYVSMFITGTTNMLAAVPSGIAPFPLLNAQQSCLNEATVTSCSPQTPTSTTDGFVAEINPNYNGSQSLVYSTYIGGSGSDTGFAIAVDSSGNAYVGGATNSTDWVSPSGSFQPAYAGTQPNTNGFIAKIGNLSGSDYPITYFTYLGGTGPDYIQAIEVDSAQSAHVTGLTYSSNIPPINPLTQGNAYNGGGDAFAALISTTLSGQGSAVPGDYFTYLGGSAFDEGTGIALDAYNASYVAGVTQSAQTAVPPFPLTSNAYLSQLPGPQSAFVSKLSAQSSFTMTGSESPSPVNAGQQATFTFNLTNSAGDNATNVIVIANVPTVGLASPPTATVSSGTGTCSGVTGSTIVCLIPTLAANGTAAVEVEVTASATTTPPVTTMTVSATASANGGTTQASAPPLTVNVTNFSVGCSTSTPIITAGDTAYIQVVYTPTTKYGYSATITPSQTTSPSMVTSPTPTFNPTTVVLAGTAPGSTTLSIGTVARPVNTGSLLRRGSSFYSTGYATWLPIGGVSLIGLGIGAGRKRRRWIVGAVLTLIAGVILLQPGCGQSTNVTTSTGGTLAGTYIVTVEGSAGTGTSQSCELNLTVN